MDIPTPNYSNYATACVCVFLLFIRFSLPEIHWIFAFEKQTKIDFYVDESEPGALLMRPVIIFLGFIDVYYLDTHSIWRATTYISCIDGERSRLQRLMARGNKSRPCGTRPLRPKTRLKAGVWKRSWVITTVEYLKNITRSQTPTLPGKSFQNRLICLTLLEIIMYFVIHECVRYNRVCKYFYENINFSKKKKKKIDSSYT